MLVRRRRRRQPVSDQCEANGVPCISTVAPWQPWFFGRGGTRERAVRLDLPLLLGPRGRRSAVPRHVGPGRDEQAGRRRCCPTTPTATPGATRAGFPRRSPKPGTPSSTRAGTRTARRTSRRRSRRSRTPARDPHRRRHPARLRDVLAAGPAAGLPPQGGDDRQGDAVPESLEALGDRRHQPDDARCGGAPTIRTSSSLTGQRPGVGRRLHRRHRQAVDAADRFRPRALRGGGGGARGRRAARTRRRCATPSPTLSRRHDRRHRRLDSGRPVPNVAKTQLVGGQWRERGNADRFDLVIVDNTGKPDVPTGATIEPTPDRQRLRDGRASERRSLRPVQALRQPGGHRRPSASRSPPARRWASSAPTAPARRRC